MARKLVVGFAVLALLTAFTVPAFAQGSAESSVRGNLSGTVVDSSGAVVTGAKVTISGPTGTKSDTTNQDGQFLFPLLSPGFYGVKVEKGSFKTADVKGIEVVTGKTSNVRVGMVAGQATEVVEVQGNAITVDTTSTAVAANLTDTFYQSVPVARGVASLFYASPGVVGGGGTGQQNPSISGGSGLENLYVADGVNITDGGFGGLGVYTRRYGSLTTGINLSFIKEVQVKTGGFEAQYGKSTGGIVQIVTKSGTSAYHGSIGGFFAPQQFEAERKHPDDAGRFNLRGKLLQQGNYDFDAEVSGYVPHFKDHLFFFGSYNPSFNKADDQFAQFVQPPDLGTGGLGPASPQVLGNFQNRNVAHNYAAKLTWKLSDNHQIEGSVFGDPTKTNNHSAFFTSSNPTTGGNLDYGTRNWVVRYNGAMTPTWLVNASFSVGENHLKDNPQFPDIYSVSDQTASRTCAQIDANIAVFGLPLDPCFDPSIPARGSFQRQGYGFTENTEGSNKNFSIDTSKSFRFLGQHNVGVGYRYDYSTYDGSRARTGPRYTVPDCNATASACGDALYGAGLGASVVGSQADASFNLIENEACTLCPLLFIPNHPAGIRVYGRVTRGEYGAPTFKTNSPYNTLFAQDAWSINKYVTVNAGLRWEQQEINGNAAHYTFTDNWSPRVGVSVDPWGNRKTKIFANYGRYTEAIPLDIAIRSLSNELDLTNMRFAPANDGTNVIVNPDGSINWVFDAAHLLNKAAGGTGATPTISQSGAIDNAVAVGTRSQYIDEYVVGMEHEFGNSGVIFTARYTDRRVKRIVEDMAALTPECGELGCEAQFYIIGNTQKSTDIFVNPNQIAYNNTTTPGGPAACSGADATNFGPGNVTDSNGGAVTFNGNDSFCLTNSSTAGLLGSDGLADGFVDPVRIYKSMEFEVNKSFSKNWQLRANYRIAKLFGNYEGTFRNDNGQSDPNISSLFDFIPGDFNLLGAQFTPGVLNTDVRHNVNGYLSYMFGNKFMKGLTLGTGVHFQTGQPLNDLLAHPVYLNAGEIPSGGRGALGRIGNFGTVDVHADYPIRITERTKIRLAADLFNLTNQRHLLAVDQNEQVTVGVQNIDFQKPGDPNLPESSTYQRPFYARFGVKFEF